LDFGRRKPGSSYGNQGGSSSFRSKGFNKNKQQQTPMSNRPVGSLTTELAGDDLFAVMQIRDIMKDGYSEEDALKVYCNTVEGDGSQLPPKLAEYAKQKGWLKGWRYPITP
jgi:hypothetical protein